MSSIAEHSLYQRGDWDRLLPEETVFMQKGRSAFSRDVGRILHSATFRRLERKTQVFPLGESDFVRTRLTHSLEVAQIAEGITLALNEQLEGLKLPKEFRIDLDVIRACAFAHDIGHPPFGHNGETALNEMMQGAGGFEGNAQTLRILAKLEKKRVGDGQAYGMNLTPRILAGALKYDEIIPVTEAKPGETIFKKGYYASEEAIVTKIKAKVIGKDYKKKLAKNSFKTLECQIVELADDIAYSTYDVEDFFKLGLMSPLTMLSESDALYQKVAGRVNRALSRHESAKNESPLKGGIFAASSVMFLPIPVLEIPLIRRIFLVKGWPMRREWGGKWQLTAIRGHNFLDSLSVRLLMRLKLYQI
ncbi:dNTP triphosphohydrolase [Acetobacteraceae bacterium]|nr:dNTP triphosphohydrolase [Acetobacteraceae bacterium]